ncbi:SDR family NAD(P)-dependent oxidoreductase [Photobacterium salinisoli]|uniref:SDR family NAD(P)-dependent oxidoreductase n=1 Tax=Photobacterium salinisoli TaxID=1616783 RepID=UPI000EA178C5|nr:SDR family NAD(P)-dependent oxidoreductase [Photobacterium salinisoli]
MSKNVFITGGASGMGLQLARQYLRQGNKVAIFDLTIPDSVSIELPQLSTNDFGFSEHCANVCDLPALQAQVEQAVATIGKPDLVIHCAGILLADRFEHHSQSDYEKVVSVNLFGTRNVVEAVLPYLNEGAHLSMISSMAGITGNYTYAAYCSSKFAVMGLSKVLRMELKPKGIDVSVICPPEVSTPMVTKEHQTIDPICLELKMVAGVLSVEQAVRDIMAGLEKRKHIIVPGFKAKLIYLLNRYMPDAVMFSIVDRVIAKGLKKVTSQ